MVYECETRRETCSGGIINVGNIGSYLERMFNKYADQRESGHKSV